MVFNLSFGERRLVLQAPVNRSCPFVNPTTFDEATEHARCLGFVVIRHREVWIVPLAKNAESFEIPCLALQRVLRVLAAGAAKTLDTEIILLLTFFLERSLDVRFNRQTMTVITGHVRRVVA